MNGIKRIVIALTFFLAFSSAAFSQRAFEGEIKKIMDEYESIGIAVVVVKNNEIIFEESYGYKDKDRKTPLENGDLFRIASISKSFTATSLMQLVEKGVVTLEDDVSDLIGFKIRNPDFPDTPITLKMILSHTSSINDSQKYSSLDIIHPEKNSTYSKSYSDYKPGTKYKYSNLNYNLAGAILENLSHIRFDKYVIQNILDPLGLYGGYDSDSLDKSRFAKLYRYNKNTGDYTYSPAAYGSIAEKKKNYQMGYSAPIFSPTGGMKTSSRDLAKYMIMHMNYGTDGNERIISEESSKLMQSTIAQASESAYYGLGIRIAEDFLPGYVLTGHTGSAYGLFSAMFFEPTEKFGFIVITNGSKRIKTGNYNSLLKPTIELLHKAFIKP